MFDLIECTCETCEEKADGHCPYCDESLCGDCFEKHKSTSHEEEG